MRSQILYDVITIVITLQSYPQAIIPRALEKKRKKETKTNNTILIQY